MSNGLTNLGYLVNSMGGGGDFGNAFPRSDADDLRKGARYIPGSITMARRRGERVAFVQECGSGCCWYWLMPNGKRYYHWSRLTYEYIGEYNERPSTKNDYGDLSFIGGAGPCPRCGNRHTSGGMFDPATDNGPRDRYSKVLI